MSRNLINLIMGLFVAVVLGLAGCGDGSSSSSSSNSTVKYTLILNNNEPTGFTYYSLQECNVGRAQALTLQSVWRADCQQK